jgi:hypothetical protein
MEKLPIHNIDSQRSQTAPSLDRKPSVCNTALLISAFIVLVVIVVMLAEVDITDFDAMLSLGTNFFVLLFCNYGMYINQFDSGIAIGKLSDVYIAVTEKYEELKRKIVDAGIDYRMNDFCIWYIKEELKSARQSLLAASGVSYKTYEPFIGKDDVDILKVENLSVQQKSAIIEANKLKPIILNSNMIMQRESVAKRKTRPRLTPTNKRYIKSGTRLARLFINSALVSAVSFNVLLDPSLATLAAIAFKVMFVVLNGFVGYKEGFSNITVDTVDYVNKQIGYMELFLTWTERTPETI